MAGFGRVAFEGEYFNQRLVNVFWYRSTQWLPGQGNPFDDVLAFVDAVVAHLATQYMDLMPTDYTLERAVGVGYDDSFNIVTSSPLVRTLGFVQTNNPMSSMGAAQTAILSLRLGTQVQINGTGTSKRNRGYLAIPCLGETLVDNYSHISTGFEALLDTFAQKVDDGITVVLPAVTLTPIRIHEKYADVLGQKILLWRTYSDVLGYTVNRVASYRRSRQPEA